MFAATYKGLKIDDIIRPNSLYGSMNAAIEAIPSMIRLRNITSIAIRNHVSGVEYEYRLRGLIIWRMQAIPSCIIPNGHNTEQYMRPKSRVAATRPMITIMLSDSIAGTNCHFARNPQYVAAIPVTSRNSNAMAVKTTTARSILIVLRYLASMQD